MYTGTGLVYCKSGGLHDLGSFPAVFAVASDARLFYPMYRARVRALTLFSGTKRRLRKPGHGR